MQCQMKLSLILVVLLALGCQAMPQRRRLSSTSSSSSSSSSSTSLLVGKSQRQVEYASTPYPAAGFRPRIPFDLPKPKLETEPEPTTIPNQTEEQDLSTTEDLDLSLRTPASTYGAPPSSSSTATNVEDTVEVEAAPARDFQPPVLDAVEDFAANGIPSEQQPVADVPALGKEQEEPQEEQEQEQEPEQESAFTPLINSDDVELKAVTTPANTYGPPLPTPATTYGAPELDEPANELDLDESQVELVEEAEQEQEITNELAASGRLILLPLGAGGAQYGRLILAVEQPSRRQKSLRSERLRRI